MNEIEKAEWLEKRRKCITGTDISAIVGLNKYASKMTVFMDKIGLGVPVVENEPMRWGKLLEPVIATRYAEETGQTIKQGVFMVKDGILGGTPDYLTDSRLLEIKTAGLYAGKQWGEPGTDQIPESYLCQVQWYLNLTDMEKADIAVLIAGQDYRVYHAYRNQNLIDLLVDAANEFWNRHIVPEVPPPLDASEGSQEYLKSFFPSSRGNIVRSTETTSVAAYKLHNVKKEIVTLDNVKTGLENQIKFEIGDNDGIEDKTFKATWKSTKDIEKIDYEGLVKRLNCSPEMIKGFTKTRPGGRRFVLSYNAEEN